MEKKEWIIATMAASKEELWTPVQIQKALFLVAQNVPDAEEAGGFEFVAHHYGPFDVTIYHELEKLEMEGIAHIFPTPHPRRFGLSREGQRLGQVYLSQLDDSVAGYIRRVAEFVHKLSFGALVRAIYKAYPHMKENSVFA